jgi:hypothetical protein
METLELSKSEVLSLYQCSNSDGKAILEGRFGKQTFIMDVRQRILTLDDAYSAVGLSALDPRFLNGTDDDIAYQQLKLAIVPSLNEGWVADYNNSDEEKWWPIFYLNESGGGFRFCVAGYVVVHTGVTGGPRLAFRTRELAIHAAERFADIFRRFYC